MKTIILISFFVFSSNILAQSALSKGSYTVGGNISFSSYKSEGTSNSQNHFIINPNLGYFFQDNFYTGITIQYISYSSGNSSSSNIAIGPEVRYFFNYDKLNPYLGLSFAWGKSTSGNNDDENTNTSITMSVGADYFITKYFALEGSIDYSFLSFKYTSSNFTDKDNSRLFVIGVGAKYYIF